MTANAKDVLARTMTEEELGESVRDACNKLGLLCYHTRDSRRSQAGFPDLVIAGGHNPAPELWLGGWANVLFAELKTEGGKVRPSQEQWLRVLVGAGCNVHVWRPSDWLNDAILRELQALAETGSKLLNGDIEAALQ